MTNGQALGTVCILDRRVRPPGPQDLQTLQALASITSRLLEHRRQGALYTPITCPPALTFLVVNDQNRVVRLSDEACRVLGVSRDMEGRDLRELLRLRWLDDTHETQVGEALARGDRWTGGVVIDVPDGPEFGALLTVAPSLLQGSKTLYVWSGGH
jgi:PAS domain-containing protein